jgi:peptidoglycan/LPS O-acetylase OafA/YrhL
MQPVTKETAKITPLKKEVTLKNSKWFKGIDSIRFVLALIVVLGHYENPIAKALKVSETRILKYFGQFLSVSFVGVAAVICFFVISGFVIHYPNRNGISNIKQFYIRRYIRVLIPLIVIYLCSIPFGNPESAVVWSLYCELIYYTIYPALSAIKASWRSKVVISYLICVTAIIIGAHNDISSLICSADIDYDGQYWQLGTGLTWLIGLPCWLLGVELANRIDKNRTRISGISIYGIRLFVFLLSTTVLILRFHFYVSYIISLTILAVFYYKWVEYEILYYKEHLPVKFLERWGTFSYSLYLTHPISFVLISAMIPLNVFSYFLYIGLAIAVAYLFYLALEGPSHALAQKLSKKKQVHASN